MERKQKGQNAALAYTLLFIALMLSAILSFRLLGAGMIYPNGEAYYTMRMGTELSKDIFYFEDTLQDRTYHASVYHYAVAWGIRMMGDNSLVVMPVVLGVVTAALLYSLLVVLGLPRKNASAAIMILAITPSFMAAYSSLTSIGFTASLSVLALTLYFQKEYWDFPWKVSGKVYFGLSIATLCVLAVTSLLGFAITIAFILALSRLESRSWRTLLFAVMLPLLILVPVFTYTNYFATTMNHLGFHALDLRESFSIFGATTGLDLFLLIIFTTGLVILWSYIKEMRIYHLVIVAFILTSLTNPLIRLYASMVMTIYCVVAIKHLYYRKWELEVTKAGTLMLLACALVFSFLSQASTLVSSEPTKETHRFITEAAQVGPGNILTDQEYGFFVEWAAQRGVMLDGESHAYRDYAERHGDYEYLLGLTRLRDAEPILQKYGIRHIIITPRMKEEMWEGKEQELLLLLRNSAKFTLIGDTESGFEHWIYTP